ncbi:MAG: hypothetical protein ACQEQ4_09470 [Fibrobacterota bacterium]
MDNMAQLQEIIKYQNTLAQTLQRPVDINTAGILWIKRYAALWRQSHGNRR